MDEVSRTLDAYESDSEEYVQRYRSVSIAALYGEPFLTAVERDSVRETPRLLDLGCGPGSDIEQFADAGCSVVGLDLTRSFLQAAAEYVPDAPLVRGDMRSLPFGEESFDGIWASASFHHVPRPAVTETLRDCRRVLRPGGHLFAGVKRDEQLDNDETARHFEYYDCEEFRSVLDSAGFTVTTAEAEGRWLGVYATR